MEPLNYKLNCILEWADSNAIDLEKTEIQPYFTRYDYDKHREVHRPRVTFYHDKERAANIRQLKRIVEFVDSGKAPYVNLKSTIILGCGEVEIVYEGAFECQTQYTCRPKGWEPEQLAAGETPMGLEEGEEF